MKKKTIPSTVVASLLLLPVIAHAHPGHDVGHGLVAGAAHPLLGVDHLLALLGTGLLAWRMGGRAGMGIAMTFPGMMTLGAILGIAGLELAFTELMILASIGALTVLVIQPPRGWPVSTVAATACFALFHGHAHGLDRDLEVIKTAMRTNQGNLGLYGSIGGPGVVKVGDPVTLA